MTLDADALVARRQLKRQLGIWRIVAVLALVAALLAGLATSGALDKPHIAVVPVFGVIYGDTALLDAIDAARDDDHVKAVIVDIDSPGGGTAASEELYVALRRVAEVKPVVAVMRSMAASGGYIVAIAGDRIFAQGNTVTGSIGVLFQSLEVSELMDTIGVSVEEVKSSPLKAEPSGFAPMSEEARAAVASIVTDTYDWFVGLVDERRPLSEEEVRIIADGRIYTGRQALAIGLVDAIGTEREAVDWLAEAHGIDPDLPLTPVDLGPPGFDLGASLAGVVGAAIGKTLSAERLTLDGLVSVWHPSAR
ncbi:MAG: signal peptide peptidase SppA [Alphaproteobacteria bacterium]|nr:signal peptide peptidase SppA [Alphaproteobacteria bacterium]